MGKSSAPRRVSENEARVYVSNLRVSPRKLGLVAESIRGLSAQDALTQLTFNRRRIAGAVKQALQSAIANAENNHQLDVDRLVVSHAAAGKGIVMKRFRPRARGRAARIHKPFANLTVVVREQEEA